MSGLVLWRWKRSKPRRGTGIIFTGTGTSSGAPMIRCVIGGEGGVPGCKSCKVAVRNGRRDPNWRNNVGLLLRWLHPDGKWRHVQIDCGKTFRESVMTWYKEHQVEHLDAVLLTHDHADAILGLDELRQLQRFDPVKRQVANTAMPVFCDVAYDTNQDPHAELAELHRQVARTEDRVGLLEDRVGHLATKATRVMQLMCVDCQVA
eukprot:symbB.v1.2.036894.t2/scaffold5316.1/size28478/1